MVMQRTRVKICGLTRTGDVRDAVRAGADAVGLVFYAKSPRSVSVAQAASLRLEVPAFVDAVSLFVDPSVDDVRRVLEQVQPDLLQFHGNESAAFCRQFAHRYIRVFRIGAPDLSTPAEVLARCRQFDDAAAWLFDTHSSGYGGSGRAFDLELLNAVLGLPDSRPVILAGGLTAATVTSALEAIHPFAVDVSSGVEVSPGIKSGKRVAAFIRAVRAYDNQNL